MEDFHRPAIAGTGLQNTPLITLEHQRCKHTRTKSASINADPVAATWAGNRDPLTARTLPNPASLNTWQA